jgi:hypothetical protein
MRMAMRFPVVRLKQFNIRKRGINYMAKETAKMLAAKQGFEILAFTLLVSTPSSLNKAWIKAKTTQEAVKAVDSLGFSPTIQQAAKSFLIQHFESRALFAGFAELHLMFYGGAGEHPRPPEAKKIIAALHALDQPKIPKRKVAK